MTGVEVDPQRWRTAARDLATAARRCPAPLPLPASDDRYTAATEALVRASDTAAQVTAAAVEPALRRAAERLTAMVAAVETTDERAAHALRVAGESR